MTGVNNLCSWPHCHEICSDQCFKVCAVVRHSDPGLSHLTHVKEAVVTYFPWHHSAGWTLETVGTRALACTISPTDTAGSESPNCGAAFEQSPHGNLLVDAPKLTDSFYNAALRPVAWMDEHELKAYTRSFLLRMRTQGG